MLDPNLRGILTQVVIVIPILAGPDGPRNEPAAAVGAHVAENFFHTRATEGALERADTRLRGLGRKRRRAVFTDGSKLEHLVLITGVELAAVRIQCVPQIVAHVIDSQNTDGYE